MTTETTPPRSPGKQAMGAHASSRISQAKASDQRKHDRQGEMAKPAPAEKG